MLLLVFAVFFVLAAIRLRRYFRSRLVFITQLDRFEARKLARSYFVLACLGWGCFALLLAVCLLLFCR